MSFERLRLASVTVLVVQIVWTLLALAGSNRMKTIGAAVFLGLFFLGCLVFLWGFAVAVGRSRTEVVPMASVFFLAGGVVPTSDRVWLFAALAAQSVVGIAGASVAPYTALAFGILVPMFGLGVVAVHGAKNGTFQPTPIPDDNAG